MKTDSNCLILQAGGPTFSIDLGRRDGWNSYASTATSFAPLSTFKVDALLTNFGNIGLDQTDLGALSGLFEVLSGDLFDKVEHFRPAE